jgi:hypothetical protein
MVLSSGPGVTVYLCQVTHPLWAQFLQLLNAACHIKWMDIYIYIYASVQMSVLLSWPGQKRLTLAQSRFHSLNRVKINRNQYAESSGTEKKDWNWVWSVR